MHTLGRVEDAAGRYSAAFHWFERANLVYGPNYRPRDVTSMAASQIVRITPHDLPDDVAVTPDMVFVCGMPRSGTTLAEAVLSRHSMVSPIGESPTLSRKARAMRRYIAQRQPSTSAWEWFGSLSDEEITHFRNYFLLQLPYRDDAARKMLTSKMPLDCFDLGAARVLVPRARFIFMSRHPLDVGLSNFMTNYHQGNGFSRKLEWAGHMIRSVSRSAADYASKLGSRLRVQSYRPLVTDPKSQIPALLLHVGLPFEDACLSPEAGDHIVRTPSLAQVRQAINTNGLNRWYHYSQHLAPLFDELGRWKWIKEWKQADAALCR